MLKFKEIERLKRITKSKQRLRGGFCHKGPQQMSIRDRVRLSSKKGAIIDRRLTERLENEFKKGDISISVVRLFANRLLRCGKKRKAENMVSKAITRLRKFGQGRPSTLFRRAVEIVRTPLSVRIYKKGRKTIYIPYLMRPEAAYNMAARNILNASREKRPEKGMPACLAGEIQNVAYMRGSALDRKLYLEKLVGENRYSYRFIRPFRRPRGQFRK